MRGLGLGLGLGLGGGAAALFNPLTLSPALWLRADSLSAGPVSSWPDISGNGHTFSQSTGTAQPGYSSNGGPNGLPCVTCSGSQYMTHAANDIIASGRNWTMFCVLKAANDGTGREVVDLAESVAFQVDAGGTRDLALLGFSNETAGSATTNWELWVAQDNGTNQSFRVNGSSQALSANSSPILAPAAASSIGGRQNGTLLWKSSVQEWIVYASVLTLSQIQQVESYVRARTAIW